jgi:hypothetical protein
MLQTTGEGCLMMENVTHEKDREERDSQSYNKHPFAVANSTSTTLIHKYFYVIWHLFSTL